MKKIFLILLISLFSPSVLANDSSFLPSPLIFKTTSLNTDLPLQIGVKIGSNIKNSDNAQDFITEQIKLLIMVKDLSATDLQKYLNQSSDRTEDLDLFLEMLQAGSAELNDNFQMIKNRLNNINIDTAQTKEKLKKLQINLNDNIKKYLANSSTKTYYKLINENNHLQYLLITTSVYQKLLRQNQTLGIILDQYIKKVLKNHNAYIKGIF